MEVDKLVDKIEKIVKGADLESLTYRNIKAKLKEESELDEDTVESKEFKQKVMEIVTGILQRNSEETRERNDESLDEIIEELPKKKTIKKRRSSTKENEAEDQKQSKPEDKKEKKKKAKSENDESVTNQSETKAEQIKNLKMYISKCGVRKVWKKELEGLGENETILHLKQFLKGLGMEGRPSLAKCKAIKEKIEAEKEMESLNPSNIIETKRRRGTGIVQETPIRSYSDDDNDNDQMEALLALGDPDAE